ncbi:MAG: gliding motility-associated C-terminal domain-containing protein [Flavipsychrobacter sp.]|nr:gliding motility-associated C-terminal domain-containing protein [Flavipsychrobacter sp.]
MKQKYILLLLSFLLCNKDIYANHIFGGELLYTNISGNTYRVAFTIYGDCSVKAISPAFDSLFSNTPLIHIYNGQAFYKDILLKPEVLGLEVSPVCPGQLSQTSCNGGTLPGVMKFVYADTVTIGGPSANWRFIMTGVLPLNSFAGRSLNITNVVDPGNTIIYLEATLNNVKGPNSSPQYATIPTPYYCINVPESYNQGAVDPDNDSLVFSLVPAVDSQATGFGNGFTSAPVQYIAPYTATAPLAAAAGSFSFNPLNGQLNFTPNLVQKALVVNQVSEYRNGILVGTSKRELAFIVSNNCSANPPVANIITGSINGGTIDSSNIFYVCEGAPSIGFNVKTSSPSNDTITVTVNNALPNATITVFNNNTDSPLINFAWNTSAVKAGVYNFYATLKDHHCPISSTQTYAYTIYVVKPNTDTAEQLSATGCVHTANIAYLFNYGLLPRTVTVSKGSEVLHTFTDTTGYILDSLRAGKYSIEVTSPHLNCPTYYFLTVVDSGALPAPYHYGFSDCIYDKPDTIKFLPFAGAHVVWHNIDGSILSGSPTPDNSILGQQQWYVIQTYNVCVSYADTVTVTVNNLPNIKITTNPGPVCLGDKVYFTASGGEDYKWTSTTNKLFTDTGGVYTNVLLPDIYKVVAHDTNSCINSDSLSLDSIENCCLFSYPNTFTPNQDNINDKYHVVLYGNTDAFEMAIYNRWGQRVFHTFNPYEGWDGNYAGQPCELGSYYFFVRSHCLTGHNEMHKGQILLYR